MTETLFVLDSNKNVIDYLSNNGVSPDAPFFDDTYSPELSTGAETYEFSTINNSRMSESLILGNYILFKYDDKYKLFQIMDVESEHEESNIITCYCEMAGLELLTDYAEPFTIEGNAVLFFNTVLQDTNWQLGRYSSSLVNNIQQVKYEKPVNVYKAIQENISIYGNIEIEFRVEFRNNRLLGFFIDVYGNGERGSKVYKRFEHGENIEGIKRKGNLYDFASAGIGFGKDNLTFTDIEWKKSKGDPADKPIGQNFVLNPVANDKFNKHGKYIKKPYEFGDDENPQDLLLHTWEALLEDGEPKLDYETELAVVSEEYEDIRIGDTNYIIDFDFNPPLLLEARVGKLELSFSDATAHKCTFSNYKEVISKVRQSISEDKINQMIDSYFPINGEQIGQGAINQGHINTTYYEVIKADIIQASVADVQILIAEKANITDLNALNADIRVLIAEKANITDLTAINGSIGTLQSDLATINTLVNGNLTSNNIQSLILSSDKVTVVNGFIKDAMIDTLSVDKVLAGDISTNKFRIVSDSGKMLISDNTIQIKDNNRVRVQIGKDASSDYNMYVWDSSGKLMFDATGLKADGIKNKIIRDDMVSDTANIDGKKLNISSVVSSINNGTTTINGTKVKLDGENQTLEVAFNSLKSSSVATAGIVSSHATSIGVIQGQISALISDTTITEDGQSKKIKDAYASLKTTVGGISTNIANVESNLSKNYSTTSAMNSAISQSTSGVITTVSKSYVSNETFNNLQIGIRNLVSNSAPKSTDGWSPNAGWISSLVDCATAPYGIAIRITNNSATTGGVHKPPIDRAKLINGEDYTISAWIRASKSCGVRFRSELMNVNTINVTTEWKLYTYTDKVNTSNTYSSNTFHINDSEISSGMWLEIHSLQLVKGNKVGDHVDAPEDMETNLTNLSNQMNGAFKDGVLTIAEKRNIQQTSDIVDGDYNSNIKVYVIVYGNTNLTSTPKSNLKTSYDEYVSTYTSLKSAITTLLNATTVTDSNISSVNSFFTTYKTKLATFNQRIQEAQDNISTGLVDTGISNLQIGIRNYVLNSALKDNANYFSLGTGTTRDITKKTPNGNYCFSFNVSGLTENTWRSVNQSWSKNFQIGKTYTASCSVLIPTGHGIDIGASFEIICWDSYGVRTGTFATPINLIILDEWQTREVTFTVPKNTAKIWIQTFVTRNGNMYTGDYSIVEGNKGIWSNAPEDTQTLIDDAITILDEDLQTQIDGKIQTYNQTADPSTTWTTTALKTEHTGDIWYNGSYTYRWSGTSWTKLTDADATAANTLASKKAQIFTTTPTIPYYKGDLWVTSLTGNGTAKTCQTTRTSGSYTASDWVEGLKYTDDTKANDVASNLSKNYSTSTEVKQLVDGLQVKVSESGGYNLLKNSTGLADTKNWDVYNLDLVGSDLSRTFISNKSSWTNNEQALQLNIQNLTTGAYAIRQSIDTVIGKKYIFTCYLAGHRSNKRIVIRGLANDATGWLASKVYANLTGGANLSDWAKVEIPFTAERTVTIIEIGITKTNDDNGFLWAKQLMVSEGSLWNPWSPHPEEVYTGITAIDKEGIVVSMQDGEGSQGYTRIAYDGMEIYDSTGERIAHFGDNNSAYIKSLTADEINNRHVLKWNEGRPTDLYVSPSATGDGTGRDVNNKASSITNALNWLWNNYGCYSWKTDINVHLAQGDYWGADNYIGGWLGTGTIFILLDPWACLRTAVNVEENGMSVVIKGTVDPFNIEVQDNAYLYLSQDGYGIRVRNSTVIVAGLNMQKEGWNGGTGVWNDYAGVAVHAEQGANVLVTNCDLVGWWYGCRTAEASTLSMLNCVGHVGCVGTASNGSILSYDKALPLSKDWFWRNIGGFLLDSGTTWDSNSKFKPKPTTQTTSDPIPTPTWRWTENTFWAGSLWTSPEGSGSTTSGKSGQWGQGKWGSYKPHRGFAAFSGVNAWCNGGRNFTVELTMTRLNTGHGYAGAVPVPKIKTTTGSFWNSGKAFARGATQTITLPSDVANALVTGGWTQLEMWAGTSTNDYSFYNNVRIRVVCEKQL